jgi:hypothetical protein
LIRTDGRPDSDTRPSQECALPKLEQVPANSRLTQELCFRQADPSQYFDLVVPWTGWDTKTAPPSYRSSPQPGPRGRRFVHASFTFLALRSGANGEN